MNEKTAKIQSFLDGELSCHEQAEVQRWLETEPEAKGIYDQLCQIKFLLKDNETPLLAPVSREFFWAGIERRLHPKRPARNPIPFWPPTWKFAGWQWAVTGAALAGLAVLLNFSFNAPANQLAIENYPTLGIDHRVDTPIEYMSYFTFRSESAAMTVVWVQNDSD